MKCPSCGENVDAQSGSRRAAFKLFETGFNTWESLFQEVTHFASELGQDRVISISHSEDGPDGVVTVWYWE